MPNDRRLDRPVEVLLTEHPGHAAELTKHALRDGCDLIVANDISAASSGFDVDRNTVSFVWPDSPVEELPPLSKQEVAAQLLDRVSKLLDHRR